MNDTVGGLASRRIRKFVTTESVDPLDDPSPTGSAGFYRHVIAVQGSEGATAPRSIAVGCQHRPVHDVVQENVANIAGGNEGFDVGRVQQSKGVIGGSKERVRRSTVVEDIVEAADV